MLGPQRLSKGTLLFYQRAVCGLSSVVKHVIGEVIEESQGEDVWVDLRRLCRQRCWEKALHFLDIQSHKNAHFNLVEAYNILLQECVDLQELEGGRRIHLHIQSNKLDSIEKLNSFLLHLYVKCYEIGSAKEVFDSMLQKDIEAWTCIIRGLIKSGQLKEAFKLFWQMEYEGILPNGILCVCILRACTMITHLMIVHVYIISLGYHLNMYLKHTFLNMYFKCGSMEDAIYIFAKLLVTVSEVSWNTLIAGYVQHGYLEKAFELFEFMKLQGARPDEVTFLNIIKVGRCNPQLLKRLHVEICHSGLESNSFVASALIDIYAGFGIVSYARKAFSAVLLRDAPLWNSMLFCFAEYGNAMEALSLYAEMENHRIAPDKVTYLSLLKACASLKYLTSGQKVHSQITLCGFENWEFVSSALVDMYVKCGSLEDARYVFDHTPNQDLVSWNAIIAGYCDREPATEAFGLFQRMENSGVKPDKVTFLTLLKACANVGAFEHSEYIRKCICDSGFHTDIFVGSTLIDTFAKCGSVYHAREIFKNMCKRDEVSWSAMLAGFAQHGQAEEAFEIFAQMQSECIPMDDVTFVGILTACSHAGLVNKGCEYFDVMKNRLGIMPTGEICACMVDLLGRAGQVQEAVSFIKEAGTESTSSVWMALLNSSKLSGDVNLAEYASKKICMLDPHCTSAFVLLSNVYAAAGSVG